MRSVGSWCDGVGETVRAAEHQAAVGAAEAECIAERGAHAGRPAGQHIVERERRIEPGRVDAGRQQLMAQRERGDHGFQRARRAQRVAGRALGRAAGRAAEQRVDCAALGGIVAGGGGAVQVDVIDLAGCDAGRGQRLLHGQARAQALRVRRRHMVRVARFADAEQQDGIVAQCLHGPVIGAFEQDESRGFADRDAVARHVERLAWLPRQQFERVEAVQRGQAQRVHAAHDRRIDQAGFEHAPRRAEDLGAGRAGRRDRHRRAAQPAIGAHEGGGCVGAVRLRVVEIGGQGAGLRIAVLVGEFGLQDAGGAGAHEDADARGAMTCLRCLDMLGEAVLREADLREPVVAAFEVAQVGAHGLGVDAIHRAGPGVEIGTLEAAWRKAAALPAQGIEGGVDAASEAARGGEVREQEGFQRGESDGSDGDGGGFMRPRRGWSI
ncbi:hypothetical protein RSK60_1940007 [Ralstonia solanacearum K60]|nr:hypothetical protein RSK60_1940007 [Ralstonia solanacearum K60]